jgi:hypothetical protein
MLRMYTQQVHDSNAQQLFLTSGLVSAGKCEASGGGCGMPVLLLLLPSAALLARTAASTDSRAMLL